MEDFVSRYENIALAGPDYYFMGDQCLTRSAIIPFLANTRIYSCILILNKIPYRWRDRYNEDTDLSLRVLSTGDLFTVNFNSLLSGKQTTGTMRGGNTDTIYEGGTNPGYQKKFDELKKTWPKYVKLTNDFHKDGRPHHHIPYTKLFKQDLVLKEGIDMGPKINEYNMVFVKR